MAAAFKAIFVEPNGIAHNVTVTEGWSLMEGAVKALVPGIEADCGGACACATCQVVVDDAWADKLPPRQEMEDTILDFAADVKPNSRLSCQIRMTAALDGIILNVPKSQY